jgi:hypothetical protein
VWERAPEKISKSKAAPLKPKRAAPRIVLAVDLSATHLPSLLG